MVLNNADECIFEGVLYTSYNTERNELYTSCKETGSGEEYTSDDAWNDVTGWASIVVPLLALSHRLLFFLLLLFFSPLVRDFDVFSEEHIELSSAARFHELSLATDSMAPTLGTTLRVLHQGGRGVHPFGGGNAVSLGLEPSGQQTVPATRSRTR